MDFNSYKPSIRIVDFGIEDGVPLRHGLRVNLVSCTNYTNPEILLGHMFNQHYLDPIFSLSNRQKQVTKEEKKWKSKSEVAGHDENPTEENSEEGFLDQVVTTNDKLAMRRESTILAEVGIMRRESGLEFGNGQVLKGYEDANGDGCLTFLRTASDRVVAEEARDKTVRDLSRLWKYLGGKSPEDHDNNEAEHRDEDSFEHRRKRHDYQNQRKSDQGSVDGPVPEQRNSPTSSTANIRNPLNHVSPMTSNPSM